jgi:hypothetical protein
MAKLTLQPGTAPANADAHQSSRRAVLGLFAAAPLAAIPSAAVAAHASTGHSSGFAAALARHYEAHAASRTYSEQVCDPAYEAYKLECAQITGPALKRERAEAKIRKRLNLGTLAKRADEMNDAAWGATWALVACPADNARDLLTKFAIIEEEEEAFDFDSTMPHVMADVRRLLGEA